MMDNEILIRVCFGVCAAFNFWAVFVHERIGARRILKPLNESDVPEQTRAMLNYSWHADTLLIIIMGVLFARSAYMPSDMLPALLAVLIAGSLGAIGIAMAFFHSPTMWQTPAPRIWPLITIIGTIGLIL